MLTVEQTVKYHNCDKVNRASGSHCDKTIRFFPKEIMLSSQLYRDLNTFLYLRLYNWLYNLFKLPMENRTVKGDSSEFFIGK